MGARQPLAEHLRTNLVTQLRVQAQCACVEAPDVESQVGQAAPHRPLLRSLHECPADARTPAPRIDADRADSGVGHGLEQRVGFVRLEHGHEPDDLAVALADERGRVRGADALLPVRGVTHGVTGADEDLRPGLVVKRIHRFTEAADGSQVFLRRLAKPLHLHGSAS
ncbi:MAG TPA: hypothetical protein PKC53_16920 [Azohydromonas sp.]|nr:hypothetical protein [Azohydromonas sp.]